MKQNGTEEKKQIGITAFIIGFVLLVGIIMPLVGWISSWLWTRFLGGVW